MYKRWGGRRLAPRRRTHTGPLRTSTSSGCTTASPPDLSKGSLDHEQTSVRYIPPRALHR
jgi:hypothetical protein